jgi:hypothetical protein
MSEKYVITISREFGSLGRSIAKRMSEMLGIMYYDRDIVEAVSKQLQLPVPTISDVEERASGAYFARRFPLGNMTTELQNQVFRVQQGIIADLASRESCIIVGRCADYVLRDTKNLMRVYVYTSYENKYDNCVNNLAMTPREAKKMIREVDQARIAYHMRYAGYMPDENKDILVDSAFLGVEGTAWFLSQAAKRRFDLE